MGVVLVEIGAFRVKLSNSMLSFADWSFQRLDPPRTDGETALEPFRAPFSSFSSNYLLTIDRFSDEMGKGMQTITS